jgi:hypothetical protein
LRYRLTRLGVHQTALIAAIACLLYNFVASWAGGIALTLETEESVG